MTFKIADIDFKKALARVDWKLLLFLLLFLNVKLAIKIPAIVLIYLLQFNFKFGFSFKSPRLPIFYLGIAGIAFIPLIAYGYYQNINYLVVFSTGIAFWLLCLLAVHQVKLSVEKNDTEIIHNTILVFFIINIVLSVFNLVHVMWESGALNPYRYQGERQKYFISTGDYIKGLTFDTSTTNAVLNAFGVLYFLVRKNPVMLLLCMAVLLLTGSNSINIALLLVFTFLFIFKSGRNQKSLIAVCFMLLVVFMTQVSPQNDQYALETFKNAINPPTRDIKKTVLESKKINKPTAEEAREQIAKAYLDSIYFSTHKAPVSQAAVVPAKIIPKTEDGRILLPQADINSLPYQSATNVTPERKQLLNFIDVHNADLPISSQDKFTPKMPGKAMGVLQTFTFLKQHPAKIIAGDGMGNFSSKLAFRATGLGFAGGFPAKYVYICKDFLSNHLDLYLFFFTRQTGLHSLTHSPNSVYDQLLAEYGVLGLLAFAIFYLGFFTKHLRKLTYGMPILLLMLVVFFTDYWFEQLSVLIFFELLLLLNIKETANKTALDYAY